MNIDISKKELQSIRDIIYNGRNYYKRNKDVFSIGTKLIKKLNYVLKKVYGHDCNGKYYLDN